MGGHSDVLVVGAGPGGLACAMLLAKAGVKVTILEKSDSLGGVFVTWQDKRGGVDDDIYGTHVSAEHNIVAPGSGVAIVVEGGESLNFDSYMIPEEDLTGGGLRLLEVDNRLVLPVNTHIRVLVTAADVLHSWAIPSFGVKIDACPGRLNQTSMFIKREGVYYGQCSEICGVNHGFMPIVVEAVNLENYVSWIADKLDGLELS